MIGWAVFQKNLKHLKINKKLGIGLFILLVAAVLTALAMHPPIPQPIAYSSFADKRTLLGIPNFWDVVSNIPFSLIGIIGLYFIFSCRAKDGKHFIHDKERYAYIAFFLGAFLIGVGSAYYHWNPNSQTLVWDRLAMTICFMSLFAAIIGERIHYKVGLYLLAPLIIIGMASVIYWHYTDDLRPYVFVQFFPLISLPLLLILFPAIYTRTTYLILCFSWYILAKILETCDKLIYAYSHNIVSGHTLKHLAAAVAIFYIYLYVSLRKRIRVS